LKNKASTTRQRYQGVIDNYLVPAFGSFSLGELTPVTLQTYFTGLGDTKLSHESIDKIRDVLASILKKAAYQKYHLIKENPMEYIEIPRATTGKRSRKPHITPEQFDELVNAIPEPYATMFFVAVYTGLRVSELIGLRWDDVGSDSITVNERYCRGDWSEPKSQASNTTIGVDRCVIERIHRLKLLSVEVKAGRAIRKYRVVKSAGPNDLVFQSVKDGKPMRDNNVLTRFIKPAARALGLGFVNWVAYEHHAQRGWSKPARTRKMSKVRCGILAFRPHWISTRSLFLNHSVAPWNLPAEWLLSE